MTKPLLSICIATYNRARYIGATLESIIPQLTEGVEVVVVDGASTDNTSAVVSRYADSCKQIRYIRLSVKGGVDQDYCRAVEYAQGQMCWFFPDDDLLKQGSVGAVLKEILKGYSLIIINSQVMNRDFSKILSDKSLQIKADEIYEGQELEQLFQRVIPYVSFIGCVVINRDLWLLREKKAYFGTEFIHVGVIFQAPLPAPVLVIAEPFIMIRFGNAQWTPRSFEIWMFKWPELLSSFKHISEQTKNEYIQMQSWRKLKDVIIHRAKGEYSLKGYRKWFALKDLSLCWRMLMLLIAIIPSVIVRSVMLLYFRLVNKEALGWHY